MRKWLMEARKLKGYSQKKIADLCDISNAHYCYIENGEREPSVQTAKKIAKILGVDWVNFFK